MSEALSGWGMLNVGVVVKVLWIVDEVMGLRAVLKRSEMEEERNKGDGRRGIDGEEERSDVWVGSITSK